MALEEKPSKETFEKWNKDSNNWIWGIFYYNKEDKRISPPKRIPGMGWTINFANTKSILSLIAVLFFFILIALALSKAH